MKIWRPLEEHWYCPRHGKQVYWGSGESKKQFKWCNRSLTEKERKKVKMGGSVVAIVSNGRLLYPGQSRFERKFSKCADRNVVIYSECYLDLHPRMVRPKVEQLLGLVWALERPGLIWRCESDRRLAVSGPTKWRPRRGWHYYAFQKNTGESKPNTKCWLPGGKTRIQAMKKAVANHAKVMRESASSTKQ